MTRAEPEIAMLHGRALAIVREAGAIALDYFGDHANRVWDKGGGQGPVSEADLAVDDFLRRRLGALTPGYGWLSEETKDDLARLESPRLWIVDPIDGTRAFIRGRPHFSVAVALVEAGRPVLGIVHAPALDETYEATVGGGARLNGAPIRVTPRGDIAGCRMLVHRQLLLSRRWTIPWPEIETDMVNSIAYRIVLVAAGRFDACLTLNPKCDWDIAAAELILAEAGGRMTTHEGAGYVYNRPSPRHRDIVAAGPALHARLLDKIKDYAFPTPRKA